MGEMLTAKQAWVDDEDLCASLQCHWSRLGRDYDRALLRECGYLWRVDLDCWQAPHEPRPTEIAAMERLGTRWNCRAGDA